MPANPTPADARALAEAVLAEIAGPKECACPWCDNIRLVHEVARALLAALDEREALLADLPHALGTCRCQVMNATPSVGWPKWVYPCTHTAAIARLEERIG